MKYFGFFLFAIIFVVNLGNCKATTFSTNCTSDKYSTFLMLNIPSCSGNPCRLKARSHQVELTFRPNINVIDPFMIIKFFPSIGGFPYNIWSGVVSGYFFIDTIYITSQTFNVPQQLLQSSGFLEIVLQERPDSNCKVYECNRVKVEIR